MSGKAKLTLMVLVFALVGTGCQYFFAKPSDTVKNFYRHIEAGEADAALSLISAGSPLAMMPQAKIKAGIAAQSIEYKKKQGIASIEILDEQITGDIAVVKGVLKFNNGESSSFEGTLVKENGAWKIVK
jgi:Domain of unknown function (DUF4878)